MRRRIRCKRFTASGDAMLMQSSVFGSSVIVGDLALKVFPAIPGGYAWNGIIAVALSTPRPITLASK